MLKPLGEEQADMRARWSDPSYRWANDSELRRRYSKEFRHEDTLQAPRHEMEQPRSGGSAEAEGDKE
jgi:hypothetical protein